MFLLLAANSARILSAGGQDEQPWEVKSSTITGVFIFKSSAAWDFIGVIPKMQSVRANMYIVFFMTLYSRKKYVWSRFFLLISHIFLV